MSKQHAGMEKGCVEGVGGEEGSAGRMHISAKCSQSSFPAGHVDSMMASRGALRSYEIFNLLGPRVWTDHLQASVACGEPGDQMSRSNAHAHARAHESEYWQRACQCPRTGWSCRPADAYTNGHKHI